MKWQVVKTPSGLAPPRPLSVRAQTIPARHYFPEHSHSWNQMVYAIAGVLTVAVEGRTYVISPEQAVWLPSGLHHRVGSLLGADFRSLWIADQKEQGLPESPTVFSVSPLLRALIVEATAIEGSENDDGYAGRVTTLILDQLRRVFPLSNALPWPSAASPLSVICEALYADPADNRTPREWGKALAMSDRTLSRRFEKELGVSFRSWRMRLRILKAQELLNGSMSVTQTAFDLGYSSTSAFIYAFRKEMGRSPLCHIRSERIGRKDS